MSEASGRRITYKRTRPNPLFEDWLEELHEEAKQTGSKLEPMLKEALESMSKYPLRLESGAECAILKGFKKKLCIFMDMRLDVYRSNFNIDANHGAFSESQQTKSSNENGPSPEKYRKNEHEIPSAVIQTTSETKKSGCHISHSSSELNTQLISYPTQVNSMINDLHSESHTNHNESEDSLTDSIQPSSSNSQNSLSTSTAASAESQSSTKAKKKERKPYKPIYRTGGFALLVTLFEQLKENPDIKSLTKEQLIEKAQKYSDESFTRPKPESFYTAWSNMSRLVTKGLIVKVKNKKTEYYLSNDGFTLAQELLKECENRPSDNDIIFDNLNKIADVEANLNSRTPNTDLTPVTVEQNETLIEMPAGSFDVILLIDKNETGGVTKKNDPTVAQFKKYPDLKHEYRSLKVGDFTWIARHKVNDDQELVLPYVIERKRMDDLGASIKDGRFHEQKFRLKKCGLDNVIYMVENYGCNKNVGLPVQSLKQALANTRVQDGFRVHETNSLSDSARFLAIMTKRLTIEFKDKILKGGNFEPSSNNLMAFDFFNKSSVKSKSLTVRETFIKMLLQLKGVSVEKALAITNKYSTPRSLIEEYKMCSEKDGQLLLANLRLGEINRNVGRNVSKAIYHLFSDFNLE